ncbi:MAG: phosphatidate cytidylyltransferase [Prolixibacteraceae bacterium]|nr:phosphatidate cytidylyltransferase [Prolixibacteraceae bacterium]
MKELAIRTAAGALYVILMLGSILLGKVTFVAFFSLVVILIMYEFFRMVNKGGYNTLMLPGILVALYLFISFFMYHFTGVGASIFWGLIPLFLFIPMAELFRKGEKNIMNSALTVLGVVFFALPLALLNGVFCYGEPQGSRPGIIIGLFLLLWVFDTGAYLIGSRFGKHKMTSNISPNKTWEGFWGGMILVMAVSVVYFDLIGFSTPLKNIVLAFLMGITGTLGDLTESLLKRNFNQKDSGSLIPGHGGLLDRFDSLFFSAPVFYAYISLI